MDITRENWLTTLWHTRRSDVVRRLAIDAVFCVGTATLVASAAKDGAFSGAAWIERFFGVFVVVLGMSLPVLAAQLWQMRSHDDPTSISLLRLARASTVPSAQQWTVPRSSRWVARGFFAFMLVIAPVVAYKAARTGMVETIFVGVWATVIVVFFVGWLTRFADRLTLADDGILHVDGVAGPRTARDVPVHDIVRIRQEGGFVTMSLTRGSIMIQTQTDDLAGLIVALQPRNPMIRYEGPWPPPRRR